MNIPGDPIIGVVHGHISVTRNWEEKISINKSGTEKT